MLFSKAVCFIKYSNFHIKKNVARCKQDIQNIYYSVPLLSKIQSDKNKNNTNYPAQHNAGYFKFRTEFRIIFQYSCSVYIKKDQEQKRNEQAEIIFPSLPVFIKVFIKVYILQYVYFPLF